LRIFIAKEFVGQAPVEEGVHVEGFQQLEGIRFLRPGESLSPTTSPTREPAKEQSMTAEV